MCEFVKFLKFIKLKVNKVFKVESFGVKIQSVLIRPDIIFDISSDKDDKYLYSDS